MAARGSLSFLLLFNRLPFGSRVTEQDLTLDRILRQEHFLSEGAYDSGTAGERHR